MDSKAVFLSYGVPRCGGGEEKILRSAAGGRRRVWFDQNELVGGDAWDAKTAARQLCALFVPVISAATQARREGYFRLE